MTTDLTACGRPVGRAARQSLLNSQNREWASEDG